MLRALGAVGGGRARSWWRRRASPQPPSAQVQLDRAPRRRRRHQRRGGSRWREQLHAVHEPRPGAREVRGGVDGVHARAERGQPLALAQRLAPRPARRSSRRASRRRPRAPTASTSLPLRRARLLAGQAEHVLAAGQLDHLRHPVAADEHRVEPLERGHARPARRPPRRRSTVVDRARRPRPRAARRPRRRPRPRPGAARRPAPRRASTGRARSPRGWVGSRSATARTSSKETAQTSHTAWVTIRSDVELRERAPRRARRAPRRGWCARARRRRSRPPRGPSGITLRVRWGSCSAPGG